MNELLLNISNLLYEKHIIYPLLILLIILYTIINSPIFYYLIDENKYLVKKNLIIKKILVIIDIIIVTIILFLLYIYNLYMGFYSIYMGVNYVIMIDIYFLIHLIVFKKSNFIYINDYLRKNLTNSFIKSILNSIKIIGKIIIYLFIASMVFSILWILVWLIINGFYVNNIDINDINTSDRIRVLLNIFQIFIVSIGIYVGYINYKELIRKNEGDHFPKIKIVDNSEVNEILENEYPFYDDKSIVLSLKLENIGDHITKIKLNDVQIIGDTINGNRYVNKRLNDNFFPLKEDVKLIIDNNIIFGKEIKELMIIFRENSIKNKFKNIMRLNIFLGLECYKVKKTIRLTLINEYYFIKKNNKKIKKGYNFKITSFDYL